jgi:UDP-N-acetyl-D-mannosaminuronic acid dehydrogenase
MKVGIVGLGKAGLPLAAVIADSGLEVLGVDIDPNRVEEINAGKNPIPEEPELGKLLTKYGGKTLKATNNYEDAKGCDAFIVIVPLFIDHEHKPDFSILETAFCAVAKVMKPGALIVLETTVPPGTTETKVKEWLDTGGKEYSLAYSPERIMTGYSVSRYREFPKVVGGVTEEAGTRALELYSKFCKQVHLVSDARTAELVKVAEGVYRDANIAVANELFKVAEAIGVDYYEVRKNANHAYCNLHLPGSVGGHCIPVYPWFLINEHEVPLIKEAREVNDKMIEYYADQLKAKIGGSGRVLVLGLTYRARVKELAYTRSIPLIKLLEKRGYEVFAADPMYTEEEIQGLNFKYTDEFEEMDGIILMNYYPELKEELLQYKHKLVDVKGVFDDRAAD